MYEDDVSRMVGALAIILQQISCETTAYMRLFIGLTHNFKVFILKLVLDILNLKIDILSLEFDKL